MTWPMVTLGTFQAVSISAVTAALQAAPDQLLNCAVESYRSGRRIWVNACTRPVTLPAEDAPTSVCKDINGCDGSPTSMIPVHKARKIAVNAKMVRTTFHGLLALRTSACV